MKNYYIYLLTNYNNRVLYVGVTNNLERRIKEHKSKEINGFTKKYNVNKLVYFEETKRCNISNRKRKANKKLDKKKEERSC